MSIGETRGQILTLVEDLESDVSGVLGALDGESGVRERIGELGAAVLGTEREDVRDALGGLLDVSEQVVELLGQLQMHLNTVHRYGEDMI